MPSPTCPEGRAALRWLSDCAMAVLKPKSSGTGFSRSWIPVLLLLALAMGPTPGATQAIRSLTLSADNDGLLFWNPPNQRLDRYYTHGLKAEAVVDWVPPWTSLLTGPGQARPSVAQIPRQKHVR